MKMEPGKLIDKRYATVLFYIMFSENHIKKEHLGIASDEAIEIL